MTGANKPPLLEGEKASGLSFRGQGFVVSHVIAMVVAVCIAGETRSNLAIL
jgi:hypothetical protein